MKYISDQRSEAGALNDCIYKKNSHNYQPFNIKDYTKQMLTITSTFPESIWICAPTYSARACRSLLAALLALLCGACAPLLKTQSDVVDSYIKAEMEKRQIPGVALAVIQHGEVIKMKGYGVANLEHDVPVTSDTVFELASVTKQFTAAALMLLVEEGRLGLDDPISRYLAKTPDTWRDITVRHLLTHTGGLATLANGFKSLYVGGVRVNYTTAQMFDAATKDAMSFSPGERWQYSDVGYFLLGMIIEKVSGQRYQEFLSQRFFEPLGMTATSILDQWSILKNRASGYTLNKGQLIQIRRILQVELASHYGVFSTVKDLAKWDFALRTARVLKQSSLDQMWSAVTLNDGTSFQYGFGWEVDEFRTRRVISHDGITGTQYARYPDDDLTVIVLTNLGRRIGTTEVNSWGLTHGVAGRYISNFLVSSLPEQPVPDAKLLRIVQDFLTDVAAGNRSPLMTQGLRNVLSPSVSNIVAQRLKTRTAFTFIACDQMEGRIRERYGARIQQMCHYKMNTTTETRYYTFWLTPEGHVADFRSALE